MKSKGVKYSNINFNTATPPKHEKAKKWATAAAKGGETALQCMKEMRQAAANGDHVAQFYLGVYFLEVEGVPHDEKNAISKELDYLSKGIKYDNSKSNNNIEFATKKENKQKNTSKDNAISKELEYLNKNTNYKNKLNGQIYLRTDVGFLKLQPNAYKDNFCVNECDNKGYDAGRNYNFGIGWYINNDYRLDLLYNKANLKFDYTQQNNTKIHYEHKVNISTLMLNLYRYKSISKYFDLYIGGGVGYTRVSSDNGVREYDNNNIKANFFNFPLNSNLFEFYLNNKLCKPDLNDLLFESSFNHSSLKSY
jgi:opacity protein-like surface antigen